MNIVAPTKEQSKHSAADIFAAFEYQWNYFVLRLINEIDAESTVSFEYLDDVDTQIKGKTRLYQIKHSVRTKSNGEIINLSNRDTDLWKTISVWMKIIDEKPQVLDDSKFYLVTNKIISENAFVQAIKWYHKNNNIDELKSAIIAIEDSSRNKKDDEVMPDLSNKKGIDVSNVITKLLSQKYLGEFCKRISILGESDQLTEQIKQCMVRRFALNDNRIDWVYNQLMTKLRDDSIDCILNHQPVSYTGAIFADRYQSILDVGRQKIHFRTDYSIKDFNGEPRGLLFMKQLFYIKDTDQNDLDRIAELTTRWLCFSNNLQKYYDNDILIQDDINNLTKNVQSAWGTSYRSKHRKITSKSSDEELCDAGCDTVDDMRNKHFSLADNPLEDFLSEGCIYYYSNSTTDIIPDLPLIGWHRDWKIKFKKQ